MAQIHARCKLAQRGTRYLRRRERAGIGLDALGIHETKGRIGIGQALMRQAFTEADVAPREAAEDVLWTLLNSREFVFNH